MPGGNAATRNGAFSSFLLFLSVMATVFVGERLYQLSREISFLESQLSDAMTEKREILTALQTAGVEDVHDLEELLLKKSDQFLTSRSGALEVPFVDVRANRTEGLPISSVKGSERLENDQTIQTVASDEDDTRMPPILGQLDMIEDGVVVGWACEKGNPGVAHVVKFFVNEVLMGSADGRGGAAHPLVNRICAGAGNIGQGGKLTQNVAFRFELPDLEEGMYTIRAFVYTGDNQWRKELNSSPQRFIESKTKPGLSDAVKRKDAIIRARNAQVAALYEQLHSRGIWTKVTNFERVRTFDETKKDNRYLAFVGLISNPNEIHSRELQRDAWFPKKADLATVAKKTGIIIRFVIGKTDWMTEIEMKNIREEIAKYEDIIVVDMRGFEDPAKKTLAFFSAVAFDYDVDFIFKAEKETVVDMVALAEYLKPQKQKGNLYMGCMKSGEVVKSARQKWFEPEHWKFGDAQGKTGEKKANYPRHAHRQLIGVSQLIGRYLAQNADVLHFYANDDVSVGVWLLGLDVEYVHESRLCCTLRTCSTASDGDRCIGIFDTVCPGVCKPDTTIPSVAKKCLMRETEDV